MKDLGQLFISGLSGLQLNEEEASFIKNENLGGIILFSHNYDSPAQLAELVNSIQSLRGENPLFICVDYEGGRVQRFKNGFTRIPSMQKIAVSGSPKFCYELHSLMAKELSACGINVNFAPCCDILVNPKNQVIGDRSFSDQEEVVTKFISSAIRGLHTYNIQSCAKHFPGHGATTKDSHYDLPYVKTPLEVIKSRELKPFVKAVKSRVTFVMMAHIVVDAIDENLPCSLSPNAYEIVRKDLRFTKLTVTDDMNMKAITDHFGQIEAAQKALSAGADLLIYRDLASCKSVYLNLKKAVENIPDKSLFLSKFSRIASIKREIFKDYKPLYIPKIPENMKKDEFAALIEKLDEINRT
ncbi:MAG: beta-N-acetylhexosaminidase [Halobacteriovoraceae bacterium]|nr:beta-N-acetylhexosaminidase [Halobacteriovoraceae bacterium]